MLLQGVRERLGRRRPQRCWCPKFHLYWVSPREPWSDPADALDGAGGSGSSVGGVSGVPAGAGASAASDGSAAGPGWKRRRRASGPGGSTSASTTPTRTRLTVPRRAKLKLGPNVARLPRRAAHDSHVERDEGEERRDYRAIARKIHSVAQGASRAAYPRRAHRGAHWDWQEVGPS